MKGRKAFELRLRESGCDFPETLSDRARNSLLRAGLRTQAAVMAQTDTQLLAQPGFGVGRLREIRSLMPYAPGQLTAAAWADLMLRSYLVRDLQTVLRGYLRRRERVEVAAKQAYRAAQWARWQARLDRRAG